MNQATLAIAPETLQCFQICKAKSNQFQRELESFRLELRKVKDVKHYTTEVNQRIADLEKQIQARETAIFGINAMLSYPPGTWVRNGTTKPGEVVDLVVAGRIPEVHVRWWGSTVPVPERPFNLTIVDPELMEYVWNGDRHSKLVRRLDQIECEELAILQEHLDRNKNASATAKQESDNDLAGDIAGKITYLKKRIEYCRKPKRDRIDLAAIKRDGGTQQRVSLNHQVVIEYADAIKAGDKFPPVKLIYDGTNYWLTDGFHTTEAAWSIGQKFIDAEITTGTKRDAILASVAVNAHHGLRRTNADKRKAVTTLLNDEEWGQWSDREIARRCKVDHKTVGKIRFDLTGDFPSENLKKYKDKHGNTSVMNISYIGVSNSVKDNERVQHAPNELRDKSDLTEKASSHNPKNDKQIITGDFPSDNHKKYKDRHEDESEMNVTNIGNRNLDSCCLGKSATVPINCPDKPSRQNLAEQFEIGQLVKLQLANFDGVGEKLKLANHSYGIIASLTENKCSFNVNILGHKSFVVSPEDLKPVESVSFCVEFSPEEFIALMTMYPHRNQIENAIKKGVLQK